MNAIVYALPVPSGNQRPTANVIALPTRTKYGLQEALPFEWPAKPNTNYLSPRVTELKPTDFTVRPTGRNDLPAVSQWSMRLVQALIEVVNGVRPISQLLRWVTPEVMSALQSQIQRKGFPKFSVRSINVHETDDGVAEVSAVFGSTNRSFAMALRLEGLDGKWRATSIIWGF
jgi:hypothetical protein